MEKFFKLCPRCGEKQTYSTKYVLKNAIINNSLCKKCNGEIQQIYCKDVKNINGNWYKNCIKCNKLLLYCSKNSAMKHKNVKCNSCAQKGTKRSYEVRKKLSIQKLGKNNPMFGKKSGMLGKHHTEKTKYKLRIATINDLRKKGIEPGKHNYNPKACKFIDKLNEEKKLNFQHALNGGEIELYGYFVDGYDKEKNVVFEYDESHHYDAFGNLKEKDIRRQQRIIESLNPSQFMRYNEEKQNLYDVIVRKEG